MSILQRALFLLLIPTLFACEPPREAYRDDLATSLCDRIFNQCSEFENKYADDNDACMLDARAAANDMLPVDQCSDDQIKADSVEVCQQEIAAWDCEGFRSVRDAAQVGSKCQASVLCEEPQ